MSPSASSQPGPASLRVLLRQRSFGAYFLANAITNTGVWFKDIAAVIFIFDLTGSATMVAGVAVTGYATSIVLAPVGGSLADRYDRKRLLGITHVVQAAAAIALTVAVAGGSQDPWLVLAALAVMGVGKAVVTPTLHAVLPSVVEARDLAPALTLQSVTFNGTRAVGPALGALVATTLGPAWAFGMTAASYLAFVGLLRLIVVAPRDTGGGAATDGQVAGVRQVLRSDRRLMVLIVMMGIVGMGTDPVLTLGPSLAEQLQAPASFAGALVSAFGLGSLAVAPALNRVRTAVGPVSLALRGLTLMLVGLVGLAVAPTTLVALGAAALAGAGFLAAGTDLTTALQQLLPDRIRGRIMALWTVSYLGSRPVAALSSGLVTDRYTVRWGIALVAVIVAIATVWLAAVHRRTSWR